MKIIRITVLILAIFPGYESVRGEPPHIDDMIRYVSMVELLVNHEKYSGMRVSVAGYLHQGDSTYVYLSREHAQLDDISSAIRISIQGADLSLCRDRFVRISARLIPAESGEYVLASVERIWTLGAGRLERISCVTPQQQSG